MALVFDLTCEVSDPFQYFQFYNTLDFSRSVFSIKRVVKSYKMLAGKRKCHSFFPLLEKLTRVLSIVATKIVFSRRIRPTAWKRFEMTSSKLYKKNIAFLKPHITFWLDRSGKSVPSIGHQPAWCQFHQHFMSSFYAPRSQKRKKTLNSSSFLRFQDLCA